MASGASMSDEDMRKELENIQLKMNATTDEVNHCVLCMYHIWMFVTDVFVQHNVEW